MPQPRSSLPSRIERGLWTIRPHGCDLLRLYVGRPDHLAPLLSLSSDPRAEFLRAARDRFKAERRQALLDVRQRHDLDDLAIEQDDDLLGRSGRDRDAKPRFALD